MESSNVNISDMNLQECSLHDSIECGRFSLNLPGLTLSDKAQEQVKPTNFPRLGDSFSFKTSLPGHYGQLSSSPIVKSEIFCISSEIYSDIDYYPSAPLDIGSWCGQRFCDIIHAFISRDGTNSLIEILLRRYLTIHEWRIMRHVSRLWRNVVERHAFPRIFHIQPSTHNIFQMLSSLSSSWTGQDISWCRQCSRWCHESVQSCIPLPRPSFSGDLPFKGFSLPNLQLQQSDSQTNLGHVLQDRMNILDHSSPEDEEAILSYEISDATSSSIKSMTFCSKCSRDISMTRVRQFQQAAHVATHDESVSRCDFCNGPALHNLSLQTKHCWNENCGRWFCAVCLSETLHTTPKACEMDTNLAQSTNEFHQTSVSQKNESSRDSLTGIPLPRLSAICSSTPLQRGAKSLLSRKMLRRL